METLHATRRYQKYKSNDNEYLSIYNQIYLSMMTVYCAHRSGSGSKIKKNVQDV